MLFGLECALGAAFSGVECERVFKDAETAQVSAKNYLFHDSPGLIVAGRVDEYEPEMIVLQISGRRGVGDILRRVVDAASFHAKRLRESGRLD